MTPEKLHKGGFSAAEIEAMEHITISRRAINKRIANNPEPELTGDEIQNLIQLRARFAERQLPVMQENSVGAMAKEYKMSKSQISSTATGNRKSTPDDIKTEIMRRSKIRRAAEKTYARHCRQALIREFGKRAVWGALGRGKRKVVKEAINMSPIVRFLSMRLTSNPAQSVPGYY